MEAQRRGRPCPASAQTEHHGAWPRRKPEPTPNAAPQFPRASKQTKPARKSNETKQAQSAQQAKSRSPPTTPPKGGAAEAAVSRLRVPSSRRLVSLVQINERRIRQNMNICQQRICKANSAGIDKSAKFAAADLFLRSKNLREQGANSFIASVSARSLHFAVRYSRSLAWLSRQHSFEYRSESQLGSQHRCAGGPYIPLGGRLPFTVGFDSRGSYHCVFHARDRAKSLPTQEELPHLRVCQQVVAFACNRDFAGNEDIADIGEFQTFLGGLLDHDDGLTVTPL